MVNDKNRNKTDRKHRNRYLLWPGIVIGFAIIVLGSFWLMNIFGQVEDSGRLKAAIIDQLYATYPNQLLTDEITRHLEDIGFQVDTYHGDEITVDFYRDLTKYDYKLLVIRSHSGTVTADGIHSWGTYLFTSERYCSWKYPGEQLFNQIKAATVDNDQPKFFAIGPKFISHSMAGKLEHTIVIIDGCSGLYSLDLAQAFVNKGASTYVAFDKAVNLNYADAVTLSFIKNLCSTGSTLASAVEDSLAETGPNTENHAVLEYYPEDVGDSGISALARLR